MRPHVTQFMTCAVFFVRVRDILARYQSLRDYSHFNSENADGQRKGSRFSKQSSALATALNNTFQLFNERRIVTFFSLSARSPHVYFTQGFDGVASCVPR